MMQWTPKGTGKSLSLPKSPGVPNNLSNFHLTLFIILLMTTLNTLVKDVSHFGNTLDGDLATVGPSGIVKVLPNLQ
jgi:hypothetical protein